MHLFLGAVVLAKNVRTGAGLERMTKGLGNKLVIEIAEGMKRPETPVQAAKLASKGGLVARAHMPILPHFKEYKKDKSLMHDYIGKVDVSYFILLLSAVFFVIHLCLVC